MERLIAVCALPRLASTIGGVRQSADVVVMVPLSAEQRRVGVRPVQRLSDASNAALSLGIRPGMRVMDAQLLAPALRTLAISDDDIQTELLGLAEQLLALSPLVEPLSFAKCALPICAIAVDVSGLPRTRARLLSDIARVIAQAGHPCTVALSSSLSLSLAVAKDAAVRPGAWKARLTDVADIDGVDGRLDIAAVMNDVADLDLVDRLRSTGIHTLADLRPLLAQGLVERLGSAAPQLLRLLRLTARSADTDPHSDPGPTDGDGEGLRAPLTPHEVIGVSRDLEYGVLHLEPLLFILRPLVEGIVRRLQIRRQRLAELTIALGSRRRPPTVLALPFSTPTVDVGVIVRVLQTRLERAFAEAGQTRVRTTGDDDSHLLSLGDDGIERLMLVARRTADATARQLALVKDGADDAAPDALLHLVSELQARYGPAQVGCLSPTRAPLPEAMSVLSWPRALPHAEHAVPRRRRPRPVASDERTSLGRFAAAWPWPLRLLSRPAAVAWQMADVKDDVLFAIVEGQDDVAPYLRHYRQVTLHDGRRALVLRDDEASADAVVGWFD
jgi:nucleotidyltransferase/DNA polymerase involved in DNA repair